MQIYESLTSDYFFVSTRKSPTGWIKGFCHEDGIDWEEWTPWFPIPNKAVVPVAETAVYVPADWFDCEDCDNRGYWKDAPGYCSCRIGQELEKQNDF